MERLEDCQWSVLISPGGDGTVGLYTDPLAMTRDDTLRIDLGGTAARQHGRIQISDAARCDGTLAKHLINGLFNSSKKTFLQPA
jgi:hypothetical protein